MPTRQRSYSEALDQEAANLRTIAERLGINIERFEAFMTSHEATDHAVSPENSSSREDITDDCQQLALKLQEERKLLIAAWEQLECDKRDLLLEKPEPVQVNAATPPPPQQQPQPQQQPTKSNTDSTVLPPLMPFQTDSDSNVSKRLQFQYLQREIDRRG